MNSPRKDFRKQKVEISVSNLSSWITEGLKQLAPGTIMPGEEIAAIEFLKRWPPDGVTIPLELTFRREVETILRE